MFRKNSASIYFVLVGIGLIGAWVTGLFRDLNPADEVSGRQMIAASVGFLLFVGSIGGILILIGRDRKPISSEELSQWEQIRLPGRAAYLRRLIFRGIVVGLLAIVWPVVSDYQETGSLNSVLGLLWVYAGILAICVFGMYYAGLRTWNNYEQIRNKRLNSKFDKN